MKKLNKVLSVVMIAVMLVCVSTNIFALNIDSVMNSGNLSGDATNKMGQIGGTIVDFITNIAMIVAVAVLAIIGIKYMIGSAEEKAEYKKSMMPYLVGAIIVFGASALAKFVVSIGENL